MQKVFSAGARVRVRGAGTGEETRVQCAHIQFARDLARVTLQEAEQVIHKREAAEEIGDGRGKHLGEEAGERICMAATTTTTNPGRIGRSKKSGDREHSAR